MPSLAVFAILRRGSFVLCRFGYDSAFCRTQHILDKYPIPRGGVTDQHVRHRAHEPAVLNDRRAAQ